MDTLDDAVATIVASANADVVGVVGDVSSDSDLDTLGGVVVARGAGLDVPYTNAGGGEFSTLSDITRPH